MVVRTLIKSVKRNRLKLRNCLDRDRDSAEQETLHILTYLHGTWGRMQIMTSSFLQQHERGKILKLKAESESGSCT